MTKSLHKIIFLIILIFIFKVEVIAQCNNTYQLDWSDPSTYTVNCGTVVPAQWTVKQDSCNYWSPQINVGGNPGDPDKVVEITVRINQSGNLTTNDFAWVRFLVNGALRKTYTVRGDTVSAVFAKTDTVHVPAGGNLVVNIALKTDLATEFWQIKNGDISGCIYSLGYPLPVELIFFRAEMTEAKARISWQTASELNNDHFLLQRSKDGENFSKLTTIKGAGNSNTINNYFYYDPVPLTGTSYYRLIQYDFDGTEKILSTATLNNVQAKPIHAIYPNPPNGQPVLIVITGLPGSNVDLELKNSSGKLVKTYNLILNTEGKADLLLSEPEIETGKGIYIFKGKINDELFYEKVILS